MVLFHSFYNWVVFHCMYVPILVYPFICQWTLKLLIYLGYCNSGAMNILVHVPFWIQLLDHMMILFLVFWGTFILFFIVASLICIPTNSVGVLPFLHTLSAFVLCRLFKSGHSDWCEVVPHCSFDLHFHCIWFAIISNDEHLFLYIRIFKVLPGDFSVCALMVNCWFWLGGWVDSVNAKERGEV